MAVRYDQKTKDEVVAFINDFNKANKRGGQSAAAAKYGITALTISKWLKASGGTGKKRGRKPGVTVAAGNKARAAGKASKITDVFERMLAIRKEIDKLQAEFDKLKTQL
jgi:hypothetical protein